MEVPAIIRSLSNAAGLLEERGIDGNWVYAGSGCLIHQELFLTAGHCVLSGFGDYVEGGGAMEERFFRVRFFIDDTVHESLCTVLCAHYSEQCDFALLKLITPIQTTYPQISSERADAGFIVHYPRGGGKVISPYTMETQSKYYELRLTYKAHGLADGSSGAPILSSSGHLIGIHTDRDVTSEETKMDKDEDPKKTEKYACRFDINLNGFSIEEIKKYNSNAAQRFVSVLSSYHLIPPVCLPPLQEVGKYSLVTVFCPEHTMTPKYPNLSSSDKCSKCGKTILSDGRYSYHCGMCNKFLCSECALSFTKCHGCGDDLTRSISRGDIHCYICSCSLTPGSYYFYCANCKRGICPRCYFSRPLPDVHLE